MVNSPIEQFQIDFEHPINPWADLEAAEAKHWTPEALCITWACSGREDWEWWNHLHNYERAAWRLRYQCEREDADRRHPPRMRSPGSILAAEEEHYRETEKLAHCWAIEIKAAYLAHKPCPIRAAHNYEHVLRWAFDLAVLHPDHLPPAPPEPAEQ